MSRPLAIDLFSGLGGWADGLLVTGWSVIGFDIERHQYGDAKYPAQAQLVLQDVLTLDGRQFKDAGLIVASPPCTEFSYMAMPWSRGKQIAAALRGDISPEGLPVPFPDEYTGSRNRQQLTALYGACFRIQREACAAAGRHIPMVVENVKGAQPWVGRANANYGSFYLWGDIATVNGNIIGLGRIGFDVPILRAPTRAGGKANPDGTGHGQGSWFAIADSKNRGAAQKNGGGGVDGVKVPGQKHMQEYAFTRGPAVLAGEKAAGKWFGPYQDRARDTVSRLSSGSSARKAASAAIAKIPFELSSYIGRVYHPGG